MFSIVAVAGMLLSPPLQEAGCSVSALRNNPDGYVWPVGDVERFVREADLVVRARADRLDDGFEDRHLLVGGPPSSVHFTVLETVHGHAQSDHLQLAGVFAEKDDFNPSPVPYRIVRRAGQGGNCHALEYREGAEYLLILREVRGALSPYWAPLAPLNEQIRGADDPWVAWVRSVLP
jgi:hypothetical protein